MKENSGWYCPECRVGVDSRTVTFEERHDICGAEVEWVDQWCECESCPNPADKMTLDEMWLCRECGEELAREAEE